MSIEFVRSQEADFEKLNADQQELVRNAYGSDSSHMCSGCAVYIGKTHLGDHTYFWHYGSSDGYVVLPVEEQQPHFDYDSGNITTFSHEAPYPTREWTTEGKEILAPPFTYLIHFDIRKWHNLYKKRIVEGGFKSEKEESDFLVCCVCNSHSIPPERAAKKLGLEPGKAVMWIGHYFLAPWELTENFTNAAISLSIIPSDRTKEKIEVL